MRLDRRGRRGQGTGNEATSVGNSGSKGHGEYATKSRKAPRGGDVRSQRFGEECWSQPRCEAGAVRVRGDALSGTKALETHWMRALRSSDLQAQIQINIRVNLEHCIY